MEQERQKRESEKEKYERERAERERFERARQQQEYRDQQDLAKKEQHEKKQQTNTSFFSGCKNLSELEAAYRKYAKKLHPDNGGNSEDFARMSNEYEQLKKAM